MVRKETKRKIIKVLSVLLNTLIMVIIVASCNNNMDYTTIQHKEKTIIFYVVADNSLVNCSNALFCDIQNYCTGKMMENINLILFLDNNNETSLYKATKTGFQKVVDYHSINSVQPQNMYNILHHINENYPASETGLILWSHGTGWLPTGNETRSFGDDNGESIDINELSTSIFKKMDYIIFDACYMGCIEVVVELSDKADYFVLSPDIVPSEGIIDTLSISTLLGDGLLEDRLKSVCKHYAEEKNSHVDFPVALVKSSELDSVMLLCNNMPTENFNEEVYYYPYRTNIIFYDIGSFLYSEGNNRTSDLMNNFIIYHTDSFHDLVCLSIFLPNENNRNYHKYYSVTKWNVMTN